MGQEQSTQAHGGTHQDQSLKTPDCDLELFLVGKSGHGKSATGNTILGMPKFSTSDMGESTTPSTHVGWTEKDGLAVKVVDGSGLPDTTLGAQQKKNQKEKIQTDTCCAFALVLVLRYGAKFTHEEKNSVALLKRMMGNDFIKQHGIIVFTHGDQFDLNKSNENFKDWCKKQTGDLRDLMKECSDRVVLFHNLEPEKGEKSTRELITLARGLGQRYTTAEPLNKSIADGRHAYSIDLVRGN